MQHRLLLLFLLISAHISFAQNVGIGTTNPTEKLDVSGNINLTGTIKTNGQQGTEGQVLTTQADGKLAWSNNTQIKNQKTFTGPFALNWTVPDGITTVFFEGWSAGGMGRNSQHGTLNNWYSGASGGYVRGVMTVIPGQAITIHVPAAQSGYTSDSLYIGYGNNSMTLYSAYFESGVSKPVLQGSFVLSTAFIEGKGGEMAMQDDAVFPGSIGGVYRYFYPAGADAPNGGRGGRGSIIVSSGSNGQVIRYQDAENGKIPGGGAGVHVAQDAATVSSKVPGAGMLILSY
ncbi:MAG: hypothetical protein QM731_00630 [Chitinophagaceae bacterium]